MAATEIIAYEAERRDEWNGFVSQSNNGTVFHSLDFLDYHEPGRFDFRHLMFYEEGELVGVLPGGVDGGVYRSPTGASFGSVAAGAGLSLAQADGMVKAFVQWCRESGIREAFLTPPMQVYAGTWDESFEYALLYNGFRLHNALYSSVIDLARIRSKADLSRNTRHKINQAVNKKVRIEENRDFDTFYPILLENKAKFSVKPTHTLEELKRIETLMPGMMTLFMAYHGTTAVAGELLFGASPQCVLNFYTMHLYQHRNLYAVNYLVEHAIRWSVKRGYRYYDYGVSADTASSDPMEPAWSLVRFKEFMGSTGCMRKTYRWAAE